MRVQKGNSETSLSCIVPGGSSMRAELPHFILKHSMIIHIEIIDLIIWGFIISMWADFDLGNKCINIDSAIPS